MEEDIIGQIEGLAKSMLTIEQVCLIVRISKIDFETNEAYQDAYNRGLLLLEIEQNKNLINLANSGSSPAQDAVNKKIQIIKIKNKK